MTSRFLDDSDDSDSPGCVANDPPHALIAQLSSIAKHRWKRWSFSTQFAPKNVDQPIPSMGIKMDINRYSDR
jgi:hypothetical protein